MRLLPRKQKKWTGASTMLWGVPFAAALCCGLPLLLTAFGLTAAGTFFIVNRYVVFGGLVIMMGILLFVRTRMGKGGTEEHDSCRPAGADAGRGSPDRDLR